jgi:ABC-type ATPase involved in cell division
MIQIRENWYHFSLNNFFWLKDQNKLRKKIMVKKQKVAIARALIARPKVILADEPTGSLDEETAKEIMQVLKAINSLGTTIIMTTHNERLSQNHKGIRKLNIKDNGVIHDEHTKEVHSVSTESLINKESTVI